MTNKEKFIEVFGEGTQRQYAIKSWSWWEQKYVSPSEDMSTLNNLLKDLFERVENIEKQMKEDKEEQLKKLEAELAYAKLYTNAQLEFVDTERKTDFYSCKNKIFPQGHGRLGDLDELVKNIVKEYGVNSIHELPQDIKTFYDKFINSAPTILDATIDYKLKNYAFFRKGKEINGSN